MLELQLEDALEVLIDHRGKTPKKLNATFELSGIPVISAANVGGGRLSLDQVRFVSPQVYERWMPVRLQMGDVILTSEGPLGEVARVSETCDLVLGQRLFALRGKSGVLSSRFLYYLLHWLPVRHQLVARSTGTTVHGIRQSELLKIRIPIPPMETQLAISDRLGALDDKIDVNRSANRTLARLLQAILAQAWEQNPAEFETRSLGDIADIVDCLHSAKPPQIPAGERGLLQLNNIGPDGTLVLNDVYLISSTDYEVWTSRIELKAGDCVITNVGRVGAVAQIPEGFRAAAGRNMTAIRPKAGVVSATYLLEALLSPRVRDEINLNTDTGTILDSLNVRNIGKLRIRVPIPPLAATLEANLRPLRALMELNLREELTLARLRDALLPQLISGRMTVN